MIVPKALAIRASRDCVAAAANEGMLSDIGVVVAAVVVDAAAAAAAAAVDPDSMAIRERRARRDTWSCGEV